MKLKKLRSFTTNVIMDVVPFVLTEHYPTSVFVVTDLNFSLQPNEAETVCHFSPSVDLVLQKILYMRNLWYQFSIVSK